MSSGFTRLAGWCAVITGAAALAYSITFAVAVIPIESSLPLSSRAHS